VPPRRRSAGTSPGRLLPEPAAELCEQPDEPSEELKGMEAPLLSGPRLAFGGPAALQHLRAFAQRPGGAGAPFEAELPGRVP
jgi:hypothetical protein